ncbi:MAG: four helix bundle protein [Bacteroidota bacterium]
MATFRFQELQIWQEAIELTDALPDVADAAEEKKKFKFAEQLRGAVMSISNNISEGSGSFSNKDFAHFLNMSRRSIFEVVNILTIFHRRKYIDSTFYLEQADKLDVLSRKITNFRKALISKH